MEHYLQHTELDTPTEKYIEGTFIPYVTIKS